MEYGLGTTTGNRCFCICITYPYVLLPPQIGEETRRLKTHSWAGQSSGLVCSLSFLDWGFPFDFGTSDPASAWWTAGKDKEICVKGVDFKKGKLEPHSLLNNYTSVVPLALLWFGSWMAPKCSYAKGVVGSLWYYREVAEPLRGGA
jgi:hypothetical protein